MTSQTYDQLAEEVAQSGDVLTLTMARLRDIHGAGKLGVNVITNISAELSRRGLDHYPSTLLLNQHDKVRLFRRGTPVAEVIRAVTVVDDADGDEKLRDIASGSANDVLRKVRELVCG